MASSLSFTTQHLRSIRNDERDRQHLTNTGIGIKRRQLTESKVVGMRIEQGIRLINSVLEVTKSSSIILIDGRGHKAGLGVLDGIKSEFHNLIPPRKIFGSMLIFLLWDAVRRKILLSNLGFVFLRILQLPFK
nr:hypothetical protein JVGAKARI_JVGAKARI_CDS_0002 [Microvirus sp.]